MYPKRFCSIIKTIRGDYGNVNPSNNNSGDYIFVNNIINKFKQNSIHLGTIRFKEHLVHVT